MFGALSCSSHVGTLESEDIAMIEPIDGLPDGVLGLRAKGEVTEDDYKNVVEPLFDEVHRKGERVQFLFDFPPEFESFSVGAAWEDFKLGMRYMRLVERCAVVSDKGWIRAATKGASLVTPAAVRTFDEGGFQGAVGWLGEAAGGATLTHRMLTDKGVLVVEPHGKLRAVDFEEVASVVDPWIENAGRLNGLVVHVEAFPGWEDSRGFFKHMRFVREHHREVRRVALCADGAMASLVPSLAEHFVQAELEHFAYGDLDRAIDWAAGE